MDKKNHVTFEQCWSVPRIMNHLVVFIILGYGSIGECVLNNNIIQLLYSVYSIQYVRFMDLCFCGHGFINI